MCKPPSSATTVSTILHESTHAAVTSTLLLFVGDGQHWLCLSGGGVSTSHVGGADHGVNDAWLVRVLCTVSLLADICVYSNAVDALAAQLFSHQLGHLEVDVSNSN